MKEKKTKDVIDRSKKSREVHANNMMKAYVTLTTAFFAMLLIVPMSTVLSLLMSGQEPPSLLDVVKIWIGNWHLSLVFIVCEVGLVKLAFLLSDRAMDIYDDIYPDERPKNDSYMRAKLRERRQAT